VNKDAVAVFRLLNEVNADALNVFKFDTEVLRLAVVDSIFVNLLFVEDVYELNEDVDTELVPPPTSTLFRLAIIDAAAGVVGVVPIGKYCHVVFPLSDAHSNSTTSF
jgi:hypothetical protein